MSKLELCDYLLKKFGSVPKIIRIAGYPACGKTTLSKLLRALLPGSIILEAECWIYDLAYRIDNKISGSNPASYDLIKCAADISRLLETGHIKTKLYSHHEGRHVRTIDIHNFENQPIILDGTTFSLSLFDQFSTSIVNIVPKDSCLWLKHAISRDIEQRFFKPFQAMKHNLRKRDDMVLYKNSSHSETISCLHDIQFIYSLSSS